MLSNLQKQLDEQRIETACEHERAPHEREEAALERDASNRIQNRLLTQLEVQRWSQPSHDRGTGGLGMTSQSPRPNNSTRAEVSRRRDRRDQSQQWRTLQVF